MINADIATLNDAELDRIAGAGPASDGPDGPFIKTRTAQIDAATVVDEIGARVRMGMDPHSAAEYVESKYLP